MTETVIRLAGVDDIPDLWRIDAATDQQFIDAGHPELSGEGEYIPIEIAKRAIAESRILVAEIEGDAVGWAFLGRSEAELCIGQIAVLPLFQQRGIGTGLMASILNRAMETNESTIVLSTQSDLAWNQPWYETFGFEVVPRNEWTSDMASVAADQSWDATRVHMRLTLSPQSI